MHITTLLGTFKNIFWVSDWTIFLSSKFFKLIYSKLIQLSNKHPAYKTFEVLKLDKSKEVKNEQPENILSISSTLEVLKLDKSNEVKIEQSANIECIFVTSEVSKLDKFNELSDLQLQNIFSIKVTSEVLKLDKSKEVNNEQ